MSDPTAEITCMECSLLIEESKFLEILSPRPDLVEKFTKQGLDRFFLTHPEATVCPISNCEFGALIPDCDFISRKISENQILLIKFALIVFGPAFIPCSVGMVTALLTAISFLVHMTKAFEDGLDLRHALRRTIVAFPFVFLFAAAFFTVAFLALLFLLTLYRKL